MSPSPQSTPRAPAHDAPTFTTFCMQMGLKPIYNHCDMWNCWCEHNYSLPIYFAFHVSDTYFWCAVTLVCVCVDALGVNCELGVLKAIAKPVHAASSPCTQRPVL